MRALPLQFLSQSRVQSGLLTTRQLAQAGFRSREIKRRVAKGEWQRITDVVVAIHSQELDRKARLWSAALHYAPCALAGPSLLEFLGMPMPYDGRIHVIGPPSGRQSPMPGVVVHTCTTFEVERRDPDGVALEIAVLQSLRWAFTDRQGIFQALWAIQRRLVSLDDLRALEQCTPSSPGTARMRRRLALLDRGTHSISEQDFAAQCRARGLPEPLRQQQRVDASGKVRYTDVEFVVNGRSLVVEIDGAHHLEPSNWVDDQLRSNELTLQDARVLRIPGIALLVDADAFFDQISRGLALLRAAA